MNPSMIRLATRLFWRELLGNRLTLILASLALAIALVYTIQSVTDRLRQAMDVGSNAFLAADRVVSSPRPLVPGLKDQAETLGLDTAQTITFNSMLFSDQGFLLVAVKGVSDSYPLRGQMFSSPDWSEMDLQPGQVMLAPRAIQQLGLSVGDTVELGEAELELVGAIEREPDSGLGRVMMSPRALVHIDDVDTMGVLIDGSRARFKLLVRGQNDNLADFQDWVEPQLESGQRYYGIRDGDSPVSEALVRAERFFRLSILLGIILCAVTIALVSHRQAEQRHRLVAIIKTLGGSRAQVRQWLLWFSLMLFALSAVFGLVLGHFSSQVLTNLLLRLLPQGNFEPSLAPAMYAIGVGALIGVCFVLPPLRQALLTPPLHILRQDNDAGFSWLDIALAVAALLIIIALFSGDALVAGIVLAAIVGLSLLLMILARLQLALLDRIRERSNGGARLAMGRLVRFRRASMLQLLGTGLALMLLALLATLRTDLLDRWQAQMPADAPNHFLVNIADYEVDEVGDWLAEQEIDHSGLVSMIRGRLTEINGEETAQSEQEVGEKRAGIYREVNFTWGEAEPPEHSPVIEGEWWSEADTGQVSVESGVALRLGLDVGDTIRIEVTGTSREAEVTSIRKVDWDNMRPNFFFIFSPDVVADFPQTFIASFNVPSGDARLIELARSFPTIAQIDLDAIMQQISKVLAQLSVALLFLLGLILACALLTLMAQLKISLEQRKLELVLMRTLGASKERLQASLRWEFLILGAMAAFSALLIAEIASFAMSLWVFELDWRPHVTVWLGMLVLAGGSFLLVGWLSSRSMLNAAVSQQLRKLSDS